MISEEFVIPQWVRIEDGATPSYAKFAVEPFERGYGTTVGNSMRRVLLASLNGAAVTAMRVEGIQHEFSAIPGIHEDMTDIVLNFKRCNLSLTDEKAVIFSFTHKGEGEVTAGEIFKDEKSIECYNPDHVIFTATNKTTKIEMEIKVAAGRGYITADQFELEHAPLGTIYLDAAFSPVTKVNFLVEDARVGQTTDYDRLILDVWTTGAISPDVAVREAADLMIDHLKIFSQQKTQEQEEEAAGSGEDPELMKRLMRPVEELELSVRAANCLKAANISTIHELVIRDETEMLGFHNFGKKSLDEIKAILETMGLGLGMKIGGAASAASTDDAPSDISDEETPDIENTEEEADDTDE